MANASGLLSPAVAPSVRRRLNPSIGVFQSGSWFSEGVFRRIVCSSTAQGAEKLSPSESGVPRLVSRGCKLVGCGSAVPNLQISNDDLSKIVDTSDEWISVRTGIRNRRILSEDVRMVNFGYASLLFDGSRCRGSKKKLQMAEVDPDDVDLMLLCTSTPEDLFGSAPQLYDITAACSGFILGLVSAACYIRGGGFNNVLVVGADALSRYVDWTDRGSCILFGDAAGAVLVQACDSEEDGLFAFDLHSDGEGQRHLKATMNENEKDHKLGTNGSLLGLLPKGSSYSCIQMNGKEVFRFAVRVVPQSIELALEKAGLPGSSIDWLLLHQANQRIIDAVAARLQLPSERVISNLANYGNTSAASIPLALDEAVRNGKVKAGHKIATAGFGAGLTWGSAIIRWG
ncbi:UNVERIFIED_CONTAM: 3-oxoacyl-[acyl-carrier-protein] synthase 3 A, chloroplastic [Sesamum calycinum]|uniref:beta-ketoacyl-[acyl-carrier-protein] synthase III n=1 Tax=Sesamum calycinum TaxID=2727403 RepID=A0AAW2RTS1_9LAMI